MVQGMFLNHEYEPLADLRVRQAICYGVDKAAVNDFFYDGKSHLIGSHMIPKLERYYEPAAETVYTYDPQKAKELLAEAGYGDGFDGTLAPNYWMKRYVTGSSKNFMNYSSAEYDETYQKALMAVDDEEKAQLYKRCQMILAEDAESVFIQDPANFVAVNKRLGGYRFYPLSAQDLSVVYEKQQ